MIGSVVVFSNVSVMIAPVPELAGLVIPVTAALDHSYVGAGDVLLLVILYVFDTLFAQFAVEGLDITAVGLTVTATLCCMPSQLLTVGVIR